MSDVPLLNHYKLPFVKRRFAQTLLGGLRICIPQKVPGFIIAIDVLLFFLPIIIGLPFTLLTAFNLHQWQIGCYVAGAVFTMIVFIMNITLAIMHSKRASVTPQNITGIEIEEEDDIKFVSCCHSSTSEFIFASKAFKINVILHAIFAGFVMAGSVWFLDMKILEDLFGSLPAAATLAAFAWISVCVGLFSLTVMRPEEIAIYRTPDFFDELALSRSFHMAICFAIHITAQ